MSASETKYELLGYLDKATREIALSSAKNLTTAKIAQDNNVSRNLASQYLNELVREGLVVKVSSHPVLYFHKRGLELYLQAKLSSCEYPSMSALISEADMLPQNDFEKAVGHNRSRGPCIAQLKSAAEYPPNGLPILIVGEVGTGKALLARLTYEFLVNRGIVSRDAQFIRIDCTRYGDDEQAFREDMLGCNGKDGLIKRAAAGVIFFEEVATLTAAQRDLFLGFIGDAGRGVNRGRANTRIMLSTSYPAGDARVRQFARAIPVIVEVPAFEERTIDERTNLALHFLRAEGRRIAAEVSVSRGALRSLVSTDFDDNVNGLRSCIINCCVGAYSGHDGDTLVVQSYNLPGKVLGASVAQFDDDQLVSCDRRTQDSETIPQAQGHYDEILDVWQAFAAGKTSFGELISEATKRERSYQDWLSFGGVGVDTRALAYEQVLTPIFEEIGTTHDVDLSRKAIYLFSVSLVGQIWGGDCRPDWRESYEQDLKDFLSALSLHLRLTATVVEQICSATKAALGIESDLLARVLLLLDINSTITASRMRDHVGIILCHGYATASSIADAANRMLHTHIYDAIDMPYDQQVSDVTGSLRRLVERYAYCSSVVLLVDMGSLADACKALEGVTNADLYVVNNVSTGLALEIGASIKAHEAIEPQLARTVSACMPSFTVLKGTRGGEVVLFCSESGIGAAERIRNLFAESLPPEVANKLVATDYQKLAKEGTQSQAFQGHAVRAIVGTMDPGIEGIPFVAFENILYSGMTDRFDAVLVRWIGEEGLTAFHSSVWKRLTLQNVIESLVILNPERLFAEVEFAVKLLQELDDHAIAPAATIGLYVHLCCLVERLVTKTPIDAYADEAAFERDHSDFITAFRRSFQDISRHYRVEVPTTEIAYVFDYITSKSATREHPSNQAAALVDE